MYQPNGNEKIIQALEQLRTEWEQAAGDVPLTAIDGNVGLLLLDVAEAAGLSDEEMFMALGSQLVKLMN